MPSPLCQTSVVFSCLDLTREDPGQLPDTCQCSQVRNGLRVAHLPHTRWYDGIMVRCVPSSEKGVPTPATGMRILCTNGLAEAHPDGSCQCSPTRPETNGACCKGLVEGGHPCTRGRGSSLAHSYLRGSEGGWMLVPETLCLKSKHTGCFMRLPHCSLQTTERELGSGQFACGCKCFLYKHGLVKCLHSPG